MRVSSAHVAVAAIIAPTAQHINLLAVILISSRQAAHRAIAQSLRKPWANIIPDFPEASRLYVLRHVSRIPAPVCVRGLVPIRDDENRSRRGATIGHGSSTGTHDRHRLV